MCFDLRSQRKRVIVSFYLSDSFYSIVKDVYETPCFSLIKPWPWPKSKANYNVILTWKERLGRLDAFTFNTFPCKFQSESAPRKGFHPTPVFLLQGNRDESQSVNHQMAQDDAQRLYQAGEGKLGTDESCFNMILATRSFPQLKATMEAYSRVWTLLKIACLS